MKAGRARDCHERDVGLDNQFAREIESVVIGNLFWRLTDLLFEQSAQMPRAHAQAGGELLFVRSMKFVSSDKRERPLDDRFLTGPGG